MSHEMLSDKALAEIEAEIARRNDATAVESACGEHNCPCHYRIPALCATVRALRLDNDKWQRAAGHWKAQHEKSEETNTALREQLARLQTPRMFPIQRSTPIRWELAQRAYDTYARMYGTNQSLERLAERGGFGLQEFACLFAGHYPEKEHQECVAKVDAVGRLISELQPQLAQVTQERNEYKERLLKATETEVEI